MCMFDCMCDCISVYACFEHNVSINISPSCLKNSSKKVGLCKIGLHRFAMPKRVNKKRKYLAKKKKNPSLFLQSPSLTISLQFSHRIKGPVFFHVAEQRRSLLYLYCTCENKVLSSFFLRERKNRKRRGTQERGRRKE